jgi:type II secretory pathway pseudopilin PulG
MPGIGQRKQAGYTLLMVVFMVATVLIAAAASAPNVLTQGRREKEEEMVWRGQQYARAIGLYYRKFGKYPTKVDDLVKATNGVRFLRQAYTDPMNKDDGAWRFIYVGPNGQLIGSLRQTSLLQTALSTPGLNGALSLGGGLQPLSPRHGSDGATNEHCHDREPIGVPAPAIPGSRLGRKHHRRGEQDQEALGSGLFGRRNLRAVGIHLESYRAECTSRTNACEPER